MRERKNRTIGNLYLNGALLILLFSLFTGACINSSSEPRKTADKDLTPDSEELQISDKSDNNPEPLPDPLSQYKIGESVKGIPLTVTEIGRGEKTGLVITGALHGNETNTKELVRAMETRYKNDPSLIPSHIRLFFLPEINPDGITKKTRRNEHDVDLNRNFPTDDWKADAVSPSKILRGSGGKSPGSEPEVQALTRWLTGRVKQSVEQVYLISFHAAYPPTGSVQPGYMVYGEPEPEPERFAGFIAKQSGYKYLKTWVTSLAITGEFIHWCEMNGIWACDIELPDYKPPSSIPKGKKETTCAVFERTIQAVLTGFLPDEDSLNNPVE